ncbi:hypothetical protein GCM10009116_21260 [Brevundimonas basaltis]|uniref:O-antigen ligase n=1 Tax=Brevundimonas basaltis TaxID=472166 RepID=A0A7W8HXR9_9CAUL|nr:hypothetical protein [Brevundimonas basaltis]MBB5291876.1 O-antigen ligase [Brevundimonas basaltis]
MRWALGFFTLCLVLAIVRAALIALAIATALALLFFFATRPRETLLFMSVFVVTGLATARPALFIVVLGIVAVAVVLAGWKRKPVPSPSFSEKRLR